MKNLKSNLLVSLFLIIGVATLSSCGKGTDLSDKDKVGKFELTINGVKETGTNVFTGAALELRTISADNGDIYLTVLINENDFNAGSEITGALSTLKITKEDGASYLLGTGVIKVISKSKIEFKNCVFAGADKDGNPAIKTVNGYISSK